MKVNIGEYRNHWISPYTIIEKVVFWKDWEKSDYSEPWVEKISDILNPACIAYNTVMTKLFPRKVKIRIDPWDTWAMDVTLAQIIHPMLKQLEATNHGAGFVDDDDVPAGIKKSDVPPVEVWDSDANLFKRWDYVMDEMIWTFEQLAADEDEDEYIVDGKIDKEKMKIYDDRIKNGLRLFGKYYRSLWD